MKSFVDIDILHCVLSVFCTQIILRRQALVSSNQFVGFGFQLHGQCPAVVSQVLEGSAAEAAGLQRGDLVERVNGRNVSRSAADSIAEIIRFETFCIYTSGRKR